MTLILFLAYAGLLTGMYFIGVRRADRMLVDTTTSIASFSTGRVRFHSLPRFHGMFVLFVSVITSVCVFVFFHFVSDLVLKQHTLAALQSTAVHSGMSADLLYSQVRNIASGALPESAVSSSLLSIARDYQEQKSVYSFWTLFFTFLSVALTGWYCTSKVAPDFRARTMVEHIIRGILALSAFLAVVTTLGIVASLLYESVKFFQHVSPLDFYFGTHWSPQLAMRADQAGSSGAFGAIPVFVGTILISTIAMIVAIPVGLMSAIYLSEYASRRVRNILKPLLEVLAGIPTVVYGFFAALTVAPFFSEVGTSLGLSVSSESALAAGFVMGIMIIPFVCSLSDDIIHAVPNRLRYASYGLGATKSETINRVVLPAALPGIAGAILLAISRAIGETMIVVMAAGLAAQLTLNPLENVTTVTVQIVTTLVGDQEFESMRTLSAFALGLSLFVVTLCFNIISLYLVKKYREEYE